jgi:methylmalonyl-CoA mutase, C-terminal domain
LGSKERREGKNGRIRVAVGRKPVSLLCLNNPMPADSRIRVLVAKPGLDGHDRGAKVIARALRDAGMEVIYTGLRQTPEMVVNAALQEDVQVIGLSILSGAHNAIVPRVMDLLKQNKMDDVLLLVGGIIPDQDIEGLKKIGVAGIFQPGTPMDDIVKFIRNRVKPEGVSAG